jgi:1-acyl-sn-glycerol-3-phosphate acyltransferase
MKDSKGQANVIIMNHLSWLDILLMMAIADGSYGALVGNSTVLTRSLKIIDIPGFVAKVETKKIPCSLQINFCCLCSLFSHHCLRYWSEESNLAMSLRGE